MAAVHPEPWFWALITTTNNNNNNNKSATQIQQIKKKDLHNPQKITVHTDLISAPV
jgi:hypothetical protein